MKLSINDDEKKFSVEAEGPHEFCSSIAQTAFYFTGVKDWKEPEKLEMLEEESTPQKPDETPKQSTKAHKAPNNTALFLNWLESNKVERFSTTAFRTVYPRISKEAALKIISHQLQKGTLSQMGKDDFIVNWEMIKHEKS